MGKKPAMKDFVVRVFIGQRNNGRWRLRGHEIEMTLAGRTPKEVLAEVATMLTAETHPFGKK